MNILITGANGFVGANLMALLSTVPEIKLFAGTRSTIDLYSLSSIKKFKDEHNIKAVIHCAIAGRGKANETVGIVHDNLLMFRNLVATFYKETYAEPIFINIASGAEFNRTHNISYYPEEQIKFQVPSDYYGFSKNVIANEILFLRKAINLRLFGCFYYNELPSRFIRANIENYILGKPIIINQDRRMDFFYLPDLATVIKSILLLNGCPYSNMNMSYKVAPRLSDIANIINNLDNKKSEIIIVDKSVGHDYCGDGRMLAGYIGHEYAMVGLEAGIKECYDKLKNEL